MSNIKRKVAAVTLAIGASLAVAAPIASASQQGVFPNPASANCVGKAVAYNNFIGYTPQQAAEFFGLTTQEYQKFLITGFCEIL